MIVHHHFFQILIRLPFSLVRNCVYIVMGDNVSRMVSSKSLSVFLHLPIHDTSTSLSAKKPRAMSASKTVSLIGSMTKPSRKRKYSSTTESVSINETLSSTVDLVHSEDEVEDAEEDKDNETRDDDSVLPMETNHEIDILWDDNDDESDSDSDELEFL
jgi:hypothetical protein